MNPHRGVVTNSYPQRPIDPPLQTVDLGVLENGGLQSSWSPEREEEDKYAPWQVPSLPYEYSESARSRFSNSTTTSIRKTTIWQRIRGCNVGWLSSFEAIIFSSWVNIFILVVPVLWILHFLDMISHVTSFFRKFCSSPSSLPPHLCSFRSSVFPFFNSYH